MSGLPGLQTYLLPGMCVFMQQSSRQRSGSRRSCAPAPTPLLRPSAHADVGCRPAVGSSSGRGSGSAGPGPVPRNPTELTPRSGDRLATYSNPFEPMDVDGDGNQGIEGEGK